MLFDPEPFEQIPGQIALQTDSPMTDHEQGMLAYSYSARERDWIVMRLEGDNWTFERIATAEDRERLPLYGWPPDEWAKASNREREARGPSA